MVSLLIAEWSTAILLLVADRAERGDRPAPGGQGRERDERAQVDDEGDGPGPPGRREAEIPAEQLVVGDVVLLAAGDQVPADGRIIAASALQIDESALTGESCPAAKDARHAEGTGSARATRPTWRS